MIEKQKAHNHFQLRAMQVPYVIGQKLSKLNSKNIRYRLKLIIQLYKKQLIDKRLKFRN